ncbi:ABATE domain-containing protein [Paenibacillus sp. R14(2021)]|uniref:CGNR zinc finger domain-containing protein n=1 Tax=Paenibacillus sp. R14(2021) TaxID=2859228 RepID=UPI002157FE45|nr:ABATE domain-containing protein [Paenibacillus sp. R14(2021)]
MLWDSFLRSNYYYGKSMTNPEDRIDNPVWLDEWLAEQKLPHPGAPSAKEMESLKRLRGHMRHIVLKLSAGESADPADLEGINRALLDGPMILRIEQSDSGYHMASMPAQVAWSGTAAAVAASFGHVLAEGDPSRFRICENTECMSAYYDETRNRSKRFCHEKYCGNLMKVRRFRARQKAADSSGSSTHGDSEI